MAMAPRRRNQGGEPVEEFAGAELEALRVIFKIIEANIKEYAPCGVAFKALPGGRSFKDVWNDPAIWVSYYPSTKIGDFGATLNKKHITLSRYTLLMGKWTTAATLAHELAHCNGASGSDTKAEDTLKKCLLHKLHDPAIIGDLIRQDRSKSPTAYV